MSAINISHIEWYGNYRVMNIMNTVLSFHVSSPGFKKYFSSPLEIKNSRFIKFSEISLPHPLIIKTPRSWTQEGTVYCRTLKNDYCKLKQPFHKTTAG